jgi:diaminopimelate decarboxylase
MTNFPIAQFDKLQTPFYCYDIALLKQTLQHIKEAASYDDYCVHYAIKANANIGVLVHIRNAGLGIDAVSGGEIKAAIDCGFDPAKIVFAGVGKADWEIELALRVGIGCFNVESLAELEIINQLAVDMGKTANIALRVNPNIDAHTHKYITTGLTENKFGISLELLNDIIAKAKAMAGVKLIGLHFHIGSQITINEPFVILCHKINGILDELEAKGIGFQMINVGGGLGIDYDDPDANPIPDFETYFRTFRDNLRLRKGQSIHFELGRSIVAQCGSLISRVLYIKEGVSKKFAIIDAGMTELIRPALYQAHHNFTVLNDSIETETYDIVGPVCESSDCFAEYETLPNLKRGDLIAIRSAGAYGEVMSSNYNYRHLNKAVFFENN